MITVQFKLLPTIEQAAMLQSSAKEYIRIANALIAQINTSVGILKLSSSNVIADLPSAVKNEAINTAKSVIKKYKKGKCESLPILKKPIITWNNQNFSLLGEILSFPLWIDGKSRRISVAVILTDC